MAIVGISSIHLLQTFINADNIPSETMLWQTIIHLTFVASAVSLAVIDRFLSPKSTAQIAEETHHREGRAAPAPPSGDSAPTPAPAPLS
jgi:uncharacterized membrane protein YqhA